MAYQPHHGQSISGARALPPDALAGRHPALERHRHAASSTTSRCRTTRSSRRGLNAPGGVQSRPGEPRDPHHRLRRQPDHQDPVHRELVPQRPAAARPALGRRARLRRHARRQPRADRRREPLHRRSARRPRGSDQPELRRAAVRDERRARRPTTPSPPRFAASSSGGLSLQANYRLSRWLDTSSDTSTGQFQDNSEPGKGAQDIACLRCERAPSLFDIPHRFVGVGGLGAARSSTAASDVARPASCSDWQLSAVVTAQSGRPFSVWNGAAFAPAATTTPTAAAARSAAASTIGRTRRRPAPSPRSFSQDDFLNGLFPTRATFRSRRRARTARWAATPSAGRATSRSTCRCRAASRLGGTRQVQVRLDVYNALNTLNLFLPNADLSVSNFGKSTQAFDARDAPDRRQVPVLSFAFEESSCRDPHSTVVTLSLRFSGPGRRRTCRSTRHAPIRRRIAVADAGREPRRSRRAHVSAPRRECRSPTPR